MFHLLRQLSFSRSFGMPELGVVSGRGQLLAAPIGEQTVAPSTVRLPFPLVRRRMLDAISDCGHTTAKDRMFFKLQSAESAKELWQLRSDLYDVVATEFTQAEAARRVNNLLPSFEGWLPEWQLKRI